MMTQIMNSSCLAVLWALLLGAWGRPAGAIEPSQRAAESRPAHRGASQAQGRVDCPVWAWEDVPAWVRPFLGRFGLPEPYPSRREPIGIETAGLDLWQANHFVAYRPETAAYIYSDNGYTPRETEYLQGALPACERLAARHTAGLNGGRDKAAALLTRALPDVLLHPGIPPLGPKCPKDRGLDDEGLLKTGVGYCNEQARVFVRLCQVSGIPARLVFLFYADRVQGHVVAEFYADGRWAMADSSWCCVFPGPDGQPMSAAECHEQVNRRFVGRAYVNRRRALLALPDEALVGRHFGTIADDTRRKERVAGKAMSVRAELRHQDPESLGNQLWAFGVLNYPLPH